VDVSALEQATQAWEDSQVKPGVFDLLADSDEDRAAMLSDYTEACLLDVQRLCELAWERGEVTSGGQAQLPFMTKER